MTVKGEKGTISNKNIIIVDDPRKQERAIIVK
jgi:hypothetical protein